MSAVQRLTLAAVVGAVVLLVWVSGVRADDTPLARAKVAIDELRYEEGNRLLDDALRGGGNTAEQVAEIYRLHGEVLAALGRPADAILKFERLLLLTPEARLADGVSPKISEPFQAAQQSTASLQPLRIRCAVNRAEPTTVAVVAEADPLAMVAGAEVVYRTADGHRAIAKPTGEATELVVLEAKTRPLWVAVVDEYGNRLRTRDIASCKDITEASDSAPVRRPIAQPRDRDPAPRFYARWVLWAGVAVAAGAGATYFGLEANSAFDEIERMHADSESYEYVDVRSVERRADRNALYANIGFAVAGGAAITAAVLMLRSRSRSPRSTVIAPTGHRDGAGVVMTVPF